MSQNNSEYDFNGVDLLLYAWKNRIILAIVAGIAFIGSIVATQFITPIYKSTVILFVSDPIPVVNSLLNIDLIIDESDLFSLASEKESEKMIQIIHSNKIRNVIIDKYNLMYHYGIDPDAKYRETELIEMYTSNVKVKRTKYQSIEIEVYDYDPVIAANIADDIAFLTDSIFRDIQQDRAFEAFKIVEKEFLSLDNEISLLQDSLKQMGKMGVVDYETQAASLNEAYVNAISRNDSKLAQRIKNEINKLVSHGSTFITIKTYLEQQTIIRSKLQHKYNMAKANMEQRIPRVLVVDNAIVSEKKAKPKFSIIVILSTISAVALAYVLLLTTDLIKKRI